MKDANFIIDNCLKFNKPGRCCLYTARKKDEAR